MEVVGTARGNHGLGHRWIVVVLGVVVGLPLLAGAVAFSPTVSAVTCNPPPHKPILIQSDGDFTQNNGVVSGSGTATDPYLIANLKIDDLSLGYALQVDNSKNAITKYFNVDCLTSNFLNAPPAGSRVVWVINVHTSTRISNVISNAGEPAGSVGVQVDGSNNIALDLITINKFGHDGIQVNSSDHITITQSKSKADGNGVLVKDSHDITIGQICNLSSSKGCNEFTYDDEFGVHVLNSYNVVIQYVLTDSNDTGGILLDGAGTYNVRLFNGHASGTGNICSKGRDGVKAPTGLIVDYVSGFAIINGAHDVFMRGWTIQGNSHFSIENGGDGMFLNPCTGLFERLPGPLTPGGGPNLDVNGNCWFNEFGFFPVPVEDCGST